MKREEQLQLLEGLHTVETVAETLKITRQSAINLLSKLRKEGHATVSGGGNIKRIYKITQTIQHPRDSGMFDIINKYSPVMKIQPWYDHQVHGKYGPGDALIDAIQTEHFRVILASLHLFKHIQNWPQLYRLAKKKECWQKVGALYEVARLFMKVRKMPRNYSAGRLKRWVALTQLHKLNFPQIAQRWKVYIPFNTIDVRETL